MHPPKAGDVSAVAKAKNEYIPTFISKKPFYVADGDDSSANDYLEHQRLQGDSVKNDKWYERGRKLGPAATKYRKGACENCGAMTHMTKDCLSRPRKQGAKWTGKDIQADETVQGLSLGWDAKRDRWNGYDAKEYTAVVDEYNTLEEMKKRRKSESKEQTMLKEDSDEAGEHEGAKYDEETDMGRQQSTSTRNLRLREDTAKYLLNLDLESAKYDPKTRSFADSGATADQAAALVAEEGFMRASGDAAEFELAQRYAWEAQERGDNNKIHLQANPTAGEVIRKKVRAESEAKKEAQRKILVEKYGVQEHLKNSPAKEVAVIESEKYVEYDKRGKIKGVPAAKAKSKYAEDVLINNHNSIWGSWWNEFKWGYTCCHSTVKNSYCTGEEGKRALEAAERQREGTSLDEATMSIAWKDEEAQKGHVENKVDVNQKAKSHAVAKKRTLEDVKNGISDEQMEEGRQKRVAFDDLMASHLGKDELVH